MVPPLQPRRNGLLGPASIVIELDQDIKQMGVEDLLPHLSAAIESWCLDTDVRPVIVEQMTRELFKTVAPFNIRTAMRASTIGNDPEEIQARAEVALSLIEEKVIERELWSGPFSQKLDDDSWAKNPYLLDEDVVVVGSAPVAPDKGVAILEGEYADRTHGVLPTIYSPRSAATLMPVGKNEDTGVLETVLGTPVIAGSGFNAVAGDSGATLSDNQVLAVISGPAIVLLGEVVVTPDEESQAIMRQKNEIIYFAERQAVALTLGGAKLATVIDVTL